MKTSPRAKLTRSPKMAGTLALDLTSLAGWMLWDGLFGRGKAAAQTWSSSRMLKIEPLKKAAKSDRAASSIVYVVPAIACEAP